VLTLTQALKEDNLPDDIRAFVEIIDRNVELEARLIDDLLDLTRIEKGKLQLNLETADAHALIGNVLDIYKSDILGKGLRLALKLDAPEHFVRADPARLQQIFWNLVKNAVKFTPEGGDVMIRTFNDEEGHLLTEVIDNGIGIDADILPQIFTAFEQGEQNITRQFGGLGLGLAISNALVEMHGGRLMAASEGRDLGATFTVELTVAMARNDGPVMGARPAAQNADRPPRRILLVDDHEDTSKVMKVLLERRGYLVTTAATMRSGIEEATNGAYDLLISDIGLPDGSGLDLMETLMRNGVPIRGVALSGFGMEEDIRRSKEVGFTEHLTKPISFQKLQEIIERLVGP
jgi:two-component system CheB/CheR fusion protein